MDADSLLLWAFVLAVTGGVGLVTFMIFYPKGEVKEEQKDAKDGKNKKNVAKEPPKGKQKVEKRRSSESVSEIPEGHPWLAGLYKGHSSPVLSIEWSPNGKYLASSADDRTVLIWVVDFFTKNHKNVRVNVPYDSARFTSWSPDSKAFLVAKLDAMDLEVYKLGKKPDGSLGNISSALTFKNVHQDRLVGAGIACSGKFIMSCSRDGKMVIWGIKGNELETLSAVDGEALSAKVSPCGRYVAACGSKPAIAVYEIIFNSESNYRGSKEFCKLEGHDTAIYDMAFNADSSRIATVTKSGQWRLFDTTGQRVNLICQGTISNFVGNKEDNAVGASVAITPDGRVVAIAHDDQIFVFIPQIGASNPISKSWIIPSARATTVAFSADSKYLASSGDKIIRIYHNVCGFYAKAQDLDSQVKDSSTSSSQKSRLQKELKETMELIKKHESNKSAV